ncbi:MAG: hypothetical protein JWO20_1317 [Candidatus Angelobacter sp.]|nr:hypothetical protein [Candidatus Angelobacter sp.]
MSFGRSSFGVSRRSTTFSRTILFVFFCLTAFPTFSFAAAKPAAGPAPTVAAQGQGKQKIFDRLDKSGKVVRHAKEYRLLRAKSFSGDLRTLPQTRPDQMELPDREDPESNAIPYPDATSDAVDPNPNAIVPAVNVPAPATNIAFEGLDFQNWGAGHPPDTNGDVGKDYYIQSVNTSLGIYRKIDGVRVAAFTFNTFMSQGHFGNLCDTNNFGDPVVLYDTFEDRWVITDFAFMLSGGAVVNPPGNFQCVAVSKTGDPVSGGWNFYSINTTGGLGDYPKFGVWPDGIYMSTNMFDYPAGGSFQTARVYAFNKAQMYAGAPTVQVASFDAPAGEFSLLPANARLQSGTPPTGSPNYFSVVWQFTNAISVYKFHVDWNSISTSTFTGPFITIAPASWASPPSTVTESGGTALDTLAVRLMMQNQYTNIAGTESLWNVHTVRGSVTTQAAIRYYQVTVTGGTVAGSTTQAATFNPDTASRFMPSVAVDRAGNMALGYSASSSTIFPAIRYAGRLSTDPVNTLSQTEQSLVEGTGAQSASFTRWGDYSAMSLDPDGCTFWYTNEYYKVTGVNDNTRIGSFNFPGCTKVANGTLSGTVISTATGNPINGATVSLGSRTTTTDATGVYTFSGLPAGTYPSITASNAGYSSVTVNSVVVNENATTTQNFSLATAPTTACVTATTQADFQTGVPTNVDLTTSPGDVILLNTPTIDQQNTTLSNSGVGITTTTWGGQTFTAGVTGQLARVDINLFCSGCTGTSPNLTLSLRAVSGGFPTGADLATATLPGNPSGASSYFTGNFASPPTLTAGTTYALVVRPTANPSAGIYALTRSATNVYAGGTRVSSSDSGTTWTAPLTSGATTDAGFKTYMATGFKPSGILVSGLKDANPAPGSNSQWNSIAWTASTPAGTGVTFQAAASNSAAGPFSFVGPDNTAGTFFTSGGSLAQFNGNRYLKYQAALSTSNSAATPALNDVTVCYNDVAPAAPTTLTVDPAGGIYGGTANLSAALTASASGVSGKTVSFTLNGNNAGTGITNASGVATLADASLSGINVGSYPSGVAASFAGDALFQPSSGSNSLTVSQASQSITFSAIPNHVTTDAPFTISAVASSGLPVTFTVLSGPATVSGNTITLTGASGTVVVQASQAGDTNYSAAPNVNQSFVVSTPFAQLVSSAAVVKTGSGYTVTVTVKNSGNVTANTVQLITAKLGTADGTPLPQPLGTLASGATATAVVNVPASAGASGALVAGKFTVQSSVGAFSTTLKITLP